MISFMSNHLHCCCYYSILCWTGSVYSQNCYYLVVVSKMIIYTLYMIYLPFFLFLSMLISIIVSITTILFFAIFIAVALD